MTGPRIRRGVPKFNILRDDLNVVAFEIETRLANRKMALDVTVDDGGWLRTDESSAYVPRPTHWWIGQFTPSFAVTFRETPDAKKQRAKVVDVEVIREALELRRDELRMRSAA